MNSRLSRWQSLKTKITLATLGIFLVGIWSLSFYASRMLREDMRDLLGKQQLSTVQLVAAQINRELEHRLVMLGSIAAMLSDVPNLSEAQAQSVVEEHSELVMLFNGGVSIHDSKGVAIADYPPLAGRRGVNYLDVDVVAAAIKEGKTTIGRPVMGKKLNQPVVGMAVPIIGRDGQSVGALAGIINLGLQNFLDQMVATPYGNTGGFLLLVPDEHLIVTATDKGRAMEVLPPVGQYPEVDRFLQVGGGSAILPDTRGQEILASKEAIPAAGWLALATLPAAEAFAPISSLLWRVTVATLLLSLLAGALTWWILRRQLKPLVDSAEMLAAMPAMQQHVAIPVVRQDEIGLLIEGFNRLVETLEQRESLLKQVLDTSSVAIFLVDRRGVITQANERMAEMFGRPVNELLGSEYVSLVHPDERETGRIQMLNLLASAIPSLELDRLYWRADQTGFWGHLSGKRFHGPDGEELGLIGVIADIDVRKHAEEKLQLAASVFTSAREGILITDPEGIIVDVNDAFTEITGYAKDEVLGQTPRLLKSGRHDPQFYAAMWRDLKKKGHWLGEIWNKRKNGEIYAEMKTISVIRDANERIQHFVALFSDITPLKEHERQLQHIAHYDVLTTLPNRVLLADRLHQAMVQAQRHKRLLAVVYLDLDGFKTINDSYGHEVGDQLLMVVAKRMRSTLREGDTLARLGGDEFVAVLPDLNEVADSVHLLSRMLKAAAKSVSIDERVLNVSASLGVTFYPQADEIDADQLLRQADQAMYQAKVTGKNRYHVFDAEQDRSVRGYHESLQRIRQAIEQHELVLYYQPKVNMRSGALIGVEALIRWQHPEDGLLSPAVFLPAIENHPLAIDVGEWVIDEALCQIERWRGEGAEVAISVNVGAYQLQHSDFVGRLKQALASHPLVQLGDLEMEVVETSAIEDLLHISQIIRECADLGVKFAVDDFGTGYSSLTYLKQLPASMLKIDQSFVRDMLGDADNLTILEGVISLASSFRRQVIAEGVETFEHGKLLLQLGCELGQGYGIARPMPAGDLLTWFAAWRPDPQWQSVQAIDRSDFPLLFAGVEHRAWVSAFDRYLQNEQPSRPPLDLHLCRFGQWLDGGGLQRYGAEADFVVVTQLHEAVHREAERLVVLKRQQGCDAAWAQHGGLHDLRDRLLAQLQVLMK